MIDLLLAVEDDKPVADLWRISWQWIPSIFQTALCRGKINSSTPL
jgi:hypothetical protein